MPKRLTTKLRVALALGIKNCTRVGIYRAAVRFGVLRCLTRPGILSAVGGDLRAAASMEVVSASDAVADACVREAEALLGGYMRYFGRHVMRVGSPPKWLKDPFSGRSWSERQHWTEVREFGKQDSDVKAVWEPSRFGWVVTLAFAFRVTGDHRYLNAIAQWVDDWIEHNPLHQGPNWKCGQEVAIRLIHFLVCVVCVLGIKRATPSIVEFVLAHARRVRRTLFYALGQDNNHAISEAVALVVAGCWLTAQPTNPAIEREARSLIKIGTKLLRRGVLRLILPDGSFAQYSVNYHRLVLETVSLGYWWSDRTGRPCLGLSHRERMCRAIEWLANLIEPETGDAPNLGGNDGAQLALPLQTAYRDFRPSVQLSSVLFRRARMYADADLDTSLCLLGIDSKRFPVERNERRSRFFVDGGLVLLMSRTQRTWAILRVPRYRFRPSHADALHLDLWSAGHNLTRDGGSYSYNSGAGWQEYFPSVAAHCSCQFDDRDQMPRLGRFLYGHWLRDEATEFEESSEGPICRSSYRDFQGARHARTVHVERDRWTIVDEVSGYQRRAVIRWRLAPADWRIENNAVSSGLAKLVVSSDVALRRLEIVEGYESRYYMERTVLPVLEIEVGPRCARVETVIDPVL